MTEPVTVVAPVAPVVTDPATPVVQPVAPVAPVTPAAPAVVDEGKPTPYAGDHGDPQLNYAVAHFVNGLGLRADSPEVVEFLKNGNDAYLKGHVAANGGDLAALEPFLLLANSGRKALDTAEETRVGALRTELEGYIGSPEKFTATLDFVKANSTTEQIAEFDKVLNMGGIAAQALLHMFTSKMAAHPATTVQGREAVGAPAVSAAEGPKVYAGKQDWRAAQRDLINRHGYRYETTPEGQALMAAFNSNWQ